MCKITFRGRSHAEGHENNKQSKTNKEHLPWRSNGLVRIREIRNNVEKLQVYVYPKREVDYKGTDKIQEEDGLRQYMLIEVEFLKQYRNLDTV